MFSLIRFPNLTEQQKKNHWTDSGIHPESVFLYGHPFFWIFKKRINKAA
jgi:hypothetical protein